MLRRFASILCVPAVCTAAAFGDAVWTGNGADDNWATLDNWTENPANNTVKILLDGAEVEVTDSVKHFNNLWAGSDDDGVTINIESGGLTTWSGFHLGREGGSTPRKFATLNQTGGLVEAKNELYMYGAGADNSAGLVTYNFGGATAGSAATLIVGGGGGNKTMVVGNGSSANAVFAASGHGTITVGTGAGTTHLRLGNGGADSTLKISGGNLNIDVTGDLQFNLNGGTSTFQATLESIVDGNPGFSTVEVKNNVTFGATGEAVFDLQLDEAFTASVGDTFTVINAGGTFNGVFDNVADGSTVTVGDYQFLADYGTDDVSGDSYFKLTTTVIPEPASLGLLAAGGLLMLGRRRR